MQRRTAFPSITVEAASNPRSSRVVSVPMNLLMGPFQQRMLRQFADSQPDLPDNVRQIFDSVGGRGIGIIGALMAFVMMLVLGAVFASLGGLLGAFFFKKKPESAPSFPAGPSGAFPSA